MTVTFRTVALEVPTVLGGLRSSRIVIEHACNLCRAKVLTADLVIHARTHHCEEVISTD